MPGSREIGKGPADYFHIPNSFEAAATTASDCNFRIMPTDARRHAETWIEMVLDISSQDVDQAFP
jgi:hypothetical protein